MRISKLPPWHQLKIGELKTAEEVLAYVEKEEIELLEEDLAELAAGIWTGPEHAAMCPFCEKFIYWEGNDIPRSCPYCRAML